MEHNGYKVDMMFETYLTTLTEKIAMLRLCALCEDYWSISVSTSMVKGKYLVIDCCMRCYSCLPF